MSYDSNYMIAFIVIICICYAIDFAVLIFFGVGSHLKEFIFPGMQGRAIILCLLSLTLQSLFVLGFFLFEVADIIDIIVEVVISISLFRFFEIIEMLSTIEAFSICHSASFHTSYKNLLENSEIVPLYEEIKSTPIKNITKPKVLQTGMCFILLQKQKIEPLGKICAWKQAKPVTNKNEAINIISFYYKCLLSYAIIIPLCFIVLAVLNRHEPNKTRARAIISAVKAVVSTFCLVNIITFVKNLEHCLAQYGLLTKFFSVKLIIFFVIVQSIILGFVSIDSQDYTEEEMQEIILYFLLNIENCFIGCLCAYSFGFVGLCVEKYKNLTCQPSSNTGMMLENKEEIPKLGLNNHNI